jgi:hypothetical protein
MNNKTLADWFRNFVRSNLTVWRWKKDHHWEYTVAEV